MPASVNLNPPQMLPPSPSASSSAHWFDTYAALAAGGVVFALAVLLLWRMYKLTVFARPQPQDMAHVLPSFSVPGDGPAVDVAALPVFVVRADDAAVVECAVCLAEVRDGERGRLLPRCGHGFHVECIDRWFGANSTCPVCRAVAIVGQPDPEPAPVGVVEQS